MQETSTIQFRINANNYTLGPNDVPFGTTLNVYLRDYLHLTGTKKMCLEGGCGVCIVAVEKNIDGRNRVYAVNSCLVSIFSCHGWVIHTIEGIGNKLDGFQKIQTLLAENNGTQCGYCSPGMVMNMYALNEDGPKTMKEIENSFGSNICRCTGYRPILTAFKKLASDSPDKEGDIEDLSPKSCLKKNQCCQGCSGACPEMPKSFSLQLGDATWVKCYKLSEVLEVLGNSGTSSCMLVGGNTARGVYWDSAASDINIDITSVEELISHQLDNDNLTLGANMSLNRIMEVFQDVSNKHANYAYLSVMADHIDLIAGVSIRNIGTLAGNMMIKHVHPGFPSDVFLILETFNATLVIVDVSGKETEVSPVKFLTEDMEKKVLRSVLLPALQDPDSYKYKSYKIMPRSQNAHAMVNAGFFVKLSKENIVESVNIVIGGINESFIHAENTEAYLLEKPLFDNEVLQNAYKILNTEAVADHNPPDASVLYRENLAIALFYKFVLSISPEGVVASKYVSGGSLIERPVSSAIQEFGSTPSNYPLSEPIIKIEALAQTSGQAQYIADIPDLPNQLFGALVLASAVANSTILSVDATEALKLDGVEAFYTASDIPGENTFTPAVTGLPVQEKLFCSGIVEYYDQPLGIIVATSQSLARRAANLVKVTYETSTKKTHLTIQDVIDDDATDKMVVATTIEATRKGTDIQHIISGKYTMGSQYHFHMEVQCANAVPTEDSLDLYPSTQWMHFSQIAAATALAIPMNKINVFIRRVGGAFGAKAVRSSMISTAAALAAYKLQKPVKLWLPMTTNVRAVGKRTPFMATYEAGVNNKGVIQYLNAKFYTNFGISANESTNMFLVPLIGHCYDISSWGFSTIMVNTDTHANCFTRSPGSLEGLGTTEAIMEHIAYQLNLDPFDVKMANYDETEHPKIREFWNTMQTWGGVKTRKQEVEEFNKENRWRKKGFSIVPMAWFLEIFANYTVLVSIFQGDGTVAVCHAGVEMGQGINTKVAQVCAYKFGIPVDMVSVKPSYNLISPNSLATGGSWTSESVVYALINACDALIERMAPVKETLTNPTWAELVNACYGVSMKLSETALFNQDMPGVQSYLIYGMCATEVEVDLLTGQKQITRVDLIEDVGDSMSPLIDIGQVEGAYVMGVGYYTQEELVFNDEGYILTQRTWNYKPPGAKDIPLNFRIKFPENNPNPVGILKSKAVAEPPLCLAVGVPLAIRNALASARLESDPSSDKWIPFDGPTTTEKTFLYALNSYDQYLLS